MKVDREVSRATSCFNPINNDDDRSTVPPSNLLNTKDQVNTTTTYDSSDDKFVHVPEDIGVVNDAITKFAQSSGMRKHSTDYNTNNEGSKSPIHRRTERNKKKYFCHQYNIF